MSESHQNDDRTNEALVDAWKTFVALMALAVGFVGSIMLFIL